MIIDTLEHAARYESLHPALGKAFAFLRRTDLLSLTDGRHPLDGGVYALVQTYATQPVEDGALEAHRRYWDIQAVIAGAEQLGYAPVPDGREIATPYSEERDILFYSGACDFVTLRPGLFALLMTHDGHMPSRLLNKPASVRKVVVKVPVL